MTTDVAALVRTWVAALAVAGFVAIWLVLARSPFPATTRTPPDASATTAAVATVADPRLAALARREQALRVRAIHVRRRHDARWAAYQRALAERQTLVRAVQSAPAASMSAPVFSTSPASSAPAPAAATTRSS